MNNGAGKDHYCTVYTANNNLKNSGWVKCGKQAKATITTKVNKKNRKIKTEWGIRGEADKFSSKGTF